MKTTGFLKVALFLALAGWVAVAYGQAPVKLKVGIIKVASLSPLFLGMDKGYFKGEGLDLDLTSVAGGAVEVLALASGDLQIGAANNSVSAIISHSRGFDLKHIASGSLNKAKTNEVMAIQVLRDSLIRTAKDLEGKVMATNTLQNITHISFLHWIDNHGGDSSKVKVVEVPFPAMEGALRDKKIDAFTGFEPFVTVPVARTTRVLGYPLGEMAPTVPVGVIVASSEYIEKNPEKVRAFIRSWNKGVDYHNSNLQEARDTIAKWTGMDPSLVAKMVLPGFEKEIVFSNLQTIIDVSHKYKFIEKPFKAEEVVSKLAAVKK